MEWSWASPLSSTWVYGRKSLVPRRPSWKPCPSFCSPLLFSVSMSHSFSAASGNVMYTETIVKLLNLNCANRGAGCCVHLIILITLVFPVSSARMVSVLWNLLAFQANSSHQWYPAPPDYAGNPAAQFLPQLHQDLNWPLSHFKRPINTNAVFRILSLELPIILLPFHLS